MSQFSFDSEVVEETHAETQPEPEPQQQVEEPQQQAEEQQQQPESQEPTAEAQQPETLALSADDFAGLEERIVRAVSLVKRERLARAAAEERAAQAEAQLQEQAPKVQQLQQEVTVLNAERGQVRQRVERLLAQLDELEL